ncbi:MAG TPA: hypothetical protein VKZ49_00690 [Polyangiaceae bacterium]|nr:hypothetical protein [Polyangiaceae bacterium]
MTSFSRRTWGFFVLCSVCAAWLALRDQSGTTIARALAEPPPPPPDAAAELSQFDRLAPERPAVRVELPNASGPAWQRERPPQRYAYSLDAEARGANPCNLPQADEAVLSAWVPIEPDGYFSRPHAPEFLDVGAFDLVVHFHGHEPARRELASAGVPLGLLGLSLPVGQSYESYFSVPGRLEAMLGEVQRQVSLQTGSEARLRHLALTAWSAGFTGIRALLRQPIAEKVDAVVLIDGLHTAREPRAAAAQIEPFARFAARAARLERLMIVTHSSIDPPNFSSTTETAHQLIAGLNGRPSEVYRRDRYGLELVHLFDRGNFHVRGYAGNDKLDHCAQFGAYRDALRTVHRHFAALEARRSGEP